MEGRRGFSRHSPKGRGQMPITVIWPLVPTPALLPCRGYARDTLEREEVGGRPPSSPEKALLGASRLASGSPDKMFLYRSLEYFFNPGHAFSPRQPAVLALPRKLGR